MFTSNETSNDVRFCGEITYLNICASHDSYACMVDSVTLHSWWLQNKGNVLQPQFYSLTCLRDHISAEIHESAHIHILPYTSNAEPHSHCSRLSFITENKPIEKKRERKHNLKIVKYIL